MSGTGRGRGVGGGQKPPEGGRRPGERPARQAPGSSRGERVSQPAGAWGGLRGQGAVQQSGGPRQPAPSGPRPSAPVPVSGEGRATLHRTGQSGGRVTEEAKAAGDNGGRGAMRGKRVLHEVIKTRPAAMNTKRGKEGREISLQANYFRLNRKPGWTLYHYRVDFSPDIELTRFRQFLLAEHRNSFDGYLFDGTSLYTAKKLQNDPLELISKNREGEPYKVTIKLVGVVEPFDYQYLQVLNLILRRAMGGLKLQLVGRNFFDPIAKANLNQYKMEIWPGYKTSIRQHEQDILLCSEIAHKVMRTDRIYDILQRCIKDSRDYQEAFKKEIIGMVVLTDYNNKTYRVDDIDFNSTPNSTFQTKDRQISYIQYYSERYKINIRDKNQPLLVSRSTEKSLRGGQSELIMLIPELCRATGLNDSMRSDFSLMKAMAEHTRLAPNARIERLKTFNKRLQQTPESMEIFSRWQFGLEQNLVELSGHVLRSEFIIFGNQKTVPAGPEADWSREFRNSQLYSVVNLQRWYVIVTSRNRREAGDFVPLIIQAAKGMKMNVAEPRYSVLNDDRNNTYVNAMETCAKSDPQLIMAIVPNNNSERYSCIKKKLCVDRAIPSQVVVSRTIIPKRGKPLSSLLSIATKVAIQMNCKLMGAPWNVNIPPPGLMTVGFDVCHSSRDQAKSYGALVATMDLRKSTRFFSTISEHHKGQELSDHIAINMIKAIKEYRELHGTLPEKILFYRDGVGEGQLHQVVETELVHLIKRLDEIYKTAGVKDYCPLTFIVVSKQINTRYFADKQNPPPGTIVDDVITLPERYDFFLVSQTVKQGTVSPTNYNVIYDKTGFNVDQIQILTYKQTHLYYNWSGTLRVPAVCQYAHKLAFLVGQFIHQQPSQLLEKQLYYL